MITLKSYTPYRKRSIRRVMVEAITSAIMFVFVWVCLVLGLGLST